MAECRKMQTHNDLIQDTHHVHVAASHDVGVVLLARAQQRELEGRGECDDKNNRHNEMYKSDKRTSEKIDGI